MKSANFFRIFHLAILLVSAGVFAYFQSHQGSFCPAHAKVATCMLRLDFGTFASNLFSGGSFGPGHSVDYELSQIQIPEYVVVYDHSDRAENEPCSTSVASETDPRQSFPTANRLPFAFPELHEDYRPIVPIYEILHAWKFHIA